MRTLLLAATAAIGLAGAANADVLNIVGSANFDDTTVTFINPANIQSSTGVFSVLGTCQSCATMTTPLTYDPFTPGQVYTASNAGSTASFTVSSEAAAPVRTATALTLDDLGTATINGVSHAGEWILTVNQFGTAIGSFSSTTNVTPGVPEPLSLAILGSGLVGLAAVRRRR